MGKTRTPEGHARQTARLNAYSLKLRANVSASGAALIAPLSMTFATPRPKLQWVARFSVPFSISGSKNRGGPNRGGPRSAEKVAFSEGVTREAERVLAGQTVHHNKFWVGLLIEKPTHRTDAVNYVDMICDAIKRAINLDDRWFSLSFVDWRINKIDPRIFIQIGQEDCWDGLICSACGGLKPLDAFPPNRKVRYGVSRYCRECMKRGRQLSRVCNPMEEALL